jgi:hypothetical protein
MEVNKMRVIVRMRGGMGNQLFILSAAFFVANCFSTKNILIDLRGYKNYKTRSYLFEGLALSKYKIEYQIKNKFLKYDFNIFIFRAFQFLYKKTFKKNFNLKFYLFNHIFTHHTLDSKGLSRLNKSKDVYMFGYFQDSKIVSSVKNEMYSVYEFIKSNSDESILRSNYFSNSLSISFRKGLDYMKNNFDISDKKFYLNGLDFYKNKFDTIIIFSDKTDFDYNNYLNYSCKDKKCISFIGTTIFNQFCLMAQSKYFIIPNSSFPWWAVYFSLEENKSCYVPYTWINGLTKNSSLRTDYMVIDNNDKKS